MHKIQQTLLILVSEKNLGEMTLRDIASLIGPNIYPQQVKHHLGQLEKRGLIRVDKIRNTIERIKEGHIKNTNLISIPILGVANCGPANSIADERIEGYLQISASFLIKKKDIFALKAIGPSMNKANIGNHNIEEGDYVLVDGENRNPKNNEYVLSIIDGMANIKKFIWDEKNHQIILLSESTKDFPPIYIHPEDEYGYMINGKVIQVIKRPNS